LNKNLTLLIFCIWSAIAISGVGFTKIIGEMIKPFVSGKLLFMLDYYLSSTLYGAYRGLSLGYIERVVSFIIIFKNQERLILSDSRLKILIGLFYIYIFISLYFIDVAIVYERIASLFKFPYWILFPLLYEKARNDSTKYIYAILVLFGLLKMYSIFNNPIYEYSIKFF
jgi:hypothetical protein